MRDNLRFYSTLLPNLLKPGFVANFILQSYEARAKPQRVRSTPSWVQVENTNRCNLNCPMCYRNTQTRELGEMSVESFRRVVAQFPHLLHVTLGGWGEPFIGRDLLAMIEHAGRRRLSVGTASNGTVFTERNIQGVFNARLLWRLGISMDSALPGKIRDYKDFPPVVETWKKLTSAQRDRGRDRPHLRFVFTLMKENLDDLEGVLALARDVGIKHVHVHGVGVFFDKSLQGGQYDLPARDQMGLALKDVASLGRSYGVRVTYPKHLVQHGQPLTCRLPWVHCFVGWDGTVHPCCMYITKRLGNILQTPFSEIWNGEAYREIRSQLKSGQEAFCAACMQPQSSSEGQQASA